MSVFVIAEAGSNHNRDIKKAFSLIDIARYAGADAVKFQTYSSETLYAKNTPDFAGYSNINDLIKKIELPREWQQTLKDYCDSCGIEFMSTPFDEKAVEELVNLGIKRLKISGFESTDPRFVKMVASTGLPLIISAGIGHNLESISEIISWVSECQKNPDLTILHCNNAYPTPEEDIFLNMIDEILKEYPEIKVGLSDHTENIITPALAVAKGAVCIEKHFTISRSLPGPDHPFAIEPYHLKEMIKGIRSAEIMCTNEGKSISRSEIPFVNALRSVVTTKEIKRGEKINTENITTKRPFTLQAIPASKFYEILGKTAKRDMAEDTCIELGDISD